MAFRTRVGVWGLVGMLAAGCAGTDKDEPVDSDRPDTDTPDPLDTPGAEDSDGADSDDSDPPDSDVPGDTEPGAVDADSDGFDESVDCDDAKPGVHPGADERCNGIDDDCDLVADEDAVNASTWYEDGDRDGFGDDATAVVSCTRSTPEQVTVGGDCDDSTGARSPTERERCDGYDNDCDLLADDDDLGVVDGERWLPDGDADGWGDPQRAVVACEVPEGYVAPTPGSPDCDDADPAVHPGAAEQINDGLDSDCNGWELCWADGDGDGFGAISGVAVESPALDCVGQRVSPSRDDCNDLVPEANPGGTEVCDDRNVDEDCDGFVNDRDSDVAGQGIWLRDDDGDGFGEVGGIDRDACVQPAGWVSVGGDCDDEDATRSPAVTEVCDANNVDEDCDGVADDLDPSAALGLKEAYSPDLDRDGFGGDGPVMMRCDRTTGYANNTADCDDSQAQISPSAPERCDAVPVDQDCDGLADDDDDDVVDPVLWSVDGDGDGYGGEGTVLACASGPGRVAGHTDCDDAAGDVHPGATERCDGVDEDCDEVVDEGFARTLFADGDGDLWGGEPACVGTPGAVAVGGDCDDGFSQVHPGANEACNLFDDNCDGLFDDEDPTLMGRTYYLDADRDGYGDPAVSDQTCVQPEGWVTVAGDCDDSRGDVSPEGVELFGNALDEDCDTRTWDTTTCQGTFVPGDFATLQAAVDAHSHHRRTICLGAGDFDTDLTYVGVGDVTVQGVSRFDTVLRGHVVVQPDVAGRITLAHLTLEGEVECKDRVFDGGSFSASNVSIRSSGAYAISSTKLDDGDMTITLENVDIELGGRAGTTAILIDEVHGWGAHVLDLRNVWIHDADRAVHGTFADEFGGIRGTVVGSLIEGVEEAVRLDMTSSAVVELAILNSVVRGARGTALVSTGSSGVLSAEDSLFFDVGGVSAGASLGSHVLVADPMLDTSFSPPRPLAGSPLINAGGVVGLATDFWGVARTGAYDIGPVEP